METNCITKVARQSSIDYSKHFRKKKKSTSGVNNAPYKQKSFVYRTGLKNGQKGLRYNELKDTYPNVDLQDSRAIAYVLGRTYKNSGGYSLDNVIKAYGY